MNGAASKLLESPGKHERQFGHACALGGGVFRVAEPFLAILIEGRASLLKVEPAPLDFEKMFDDVGGSFLLGATQERLAA